MENRNTFKRTTYPPEEKSERDPLNPQNIATSIAAIHSCWNCEYREVCKYVTDSTDEEAANQCEQFRPFATLKERQEERIVEKADKHGGIDHLVGLDELAMEGRLFIMPPHTQLPEVVEKLYGQPGNFNVRDYNDLYGKVCNLQCMIANLPQLISDEKTFKSLCPEEWQELLLIACNTLLGNARNQVKLNQEKVKKGAQ